VRANAVILAAVAAAMAIPGSAWAQGNVNDGRTCSYAQDEEVSEGAGGVTVYADTDGDGGMTGTADASAGACADGLPIGGAAEVGTGADGSYAVIDGDNDNSANDPSDQSDGYVGLSNYETGTKSNCDSNPSAAPSSNSGGCFGVKGVITLNNDELLFVCGNTSGNTWATTYRDGCLIP
jgi:hypothetical protein